MADSSRAVVSYWPTYGHLVLDNRLGSPESVWIGYGNCPARHDLNSVDQAVKPQNKC